MSATLLLAGCVLPGSFDVDERDPSGDADAAIVDGGDVALGDLVADTVAPVDMLADGTANDVANDGESDIAIDLDMGSCQPSEISCGDVCVDPTSSVDHCGGCDNGCATECVNAVCDPNVSVTVGVEHACAVTSLDRLRCWGDNTYGQVNGVASATPTSAVRPGAYVKAAAGVDFTCAITTSGDVECWGNNDTGQLGYAGQGPTVDAAWTTPVVDIHASESEGKAFVCALDSAEEVWCWGANFGTTFPGNQGVPTMILEGAIALDVGFHHACAIAVDAATDETSIECWGENFAELNQWTRLGSIQMQCTQSDTACSTPGPAGPDENWVSVAAGYRHTCALSDMGRRFCWGESDFFAVGDDTANFTDEVNFNEIWTGGRNTCARNAVNGFIECFGRNAQGSLGSPPPAHGPREVFALRGATALDISEDVVCAVLADGTVWCSGTNVHGQLDGAAASTNRIGADAPVTLDWGFAGEAVAELVTGGNVTCGLGSSGTLRCFGSDVHGLLQLPALGQAQPIHSPSPVDVGLDIDEAVLGTRHGCYRKGVVVSCWGTNGLGESDPSAPGGTVPPTVVDLTANLSWNDALTVLAGYNHSCAVDTDGKLACWGDFDNDMVANPPTQRIAIVSGAAAGHGWTCYYNSSGQLACDGVLGVSTTISSLATASDDEICWITPDPENELACRSTSSSALATNPGTTYVPTATGVAIPLGNGVADSGSFHHCYADADELHCWGSNWAGQVGDDNVTRNTETTLTHQLIGNVVSVGAGHTHTCVLLDDGTTQCWGSSVNGSLGPNVVGTTHEFVQAYP